MQDDSLVTELNITTDRFLKSLGTKHPESEAHLVIHATIKSRSGSSRRAEGLTVRLLRQKLTLPHKSFRLWDYEAN